MSRKPPGYQVYLTQARLQALADARYQYTLAIERAKDATHLLPTNTGLRSLLNKCSASKSSSIYITAAEGEALEDADCYYSMLIEAASDPEAEFLEAKAGLHDLVAKVQRARARPSNRQTIKQALRYADQILGAK